MNIAVYSHYFTPEIGAPPARIYDLSQQWLALGHQVQVVTCFPNHPVGQLYSGYESGLYRHEQLDGINVHRHWTYITPNEGLIKKTLGHVSYLPSALLFSNRHVRDPDVAIGTSPTFFAAMAAAGTAVRRKVPFIMEVRDLWPAIFIELGILHNRYLIQWLAKWELALYRWSTKIVTVTEAFRSNLIARGVSPEKVVTIRNGADVEFWQPTEPPSQLHRQLGLEGRFIVLYVGTHGISHGLGRILDSAQQLREYPEIRFLFVGAGAEKARLIRKAEADGLDNVRFLDSVSKSAVRDYYALADVCLVPLRNISLFETFIPSKIFEIMAMGRPIVASVRGETADILRQSGGAKVVEPEDRNAITRAILHLWRHRDEACVMGQRSRKFVVENYSRRSLAMTYADVIKEAIDQYRHERR